MQYTFFQPNFDQAVLSGADFVRMTQLAATTGDIYESTQSCHALAVGPTSDFANYRVAYFDTQQSPTFLNQLAIGPGRPFIGRLDARNVQKYQPANRPGRILIYPIDLWDEEFTPTGFNPVQDKLIFETPVIDVFQYFTPKVPASIRYDKTYEYDQLPFGLDDVYVCVPFYGRKYGLVQFQNATDQIIEITVSGLNFNMTEDGPLLKAISGPTNIAVGAVAVIPITSQANGMFDYIQVQLNPAAGPTGNSPLRITVSDSQSGL